jgi:hypothetical protein
LIYRILIGGFGLTIVLRKADFEIGDRFGNLTITDILGDIIYSKRSQRLYCYNCLCDCGKTRIVPRIYLLNNSVTSCGHTKLANGRFKNKSPFPFDYFTHIKRNARLRNIYFDESITTQILYDILLSQDKKCSFTGLDINLYVSKKDKISQTGSLDRIDSKKGYTIDNIQWVHKDLNKMKWHLNNSYFIDMCKAVIRSHDKNYNWFVLSDFNRVKSIPNRYFKMVQKRKHDCNVTQDLLLDLYRKQRGLCRYSKTGLYFDTKTASLDRIDSSKGYIEGNVQWVHRNINLMKLDHSEEKFLNYCKLVADHNKEENV